MRIHYTRWLAVWPDIYTATLDAKLLDVREYLKCDIKWDNETDYTNNYVDFIFHNTDDELFYRLKWGIINEKTSIY